MLQGCCFQLLVSRLLLLFRVVMHWVFRLSLLLFALSGLRRLSTRFSRSQCLVLRLLGPSLQSTPIALFQLVSHLQPGFRALTNSVLVLFLLLFAVSLSFRLFPFLRSFLRLRLGTQGPFHEIQVSALNLLRLSAAGVGLLLLLFCSLLLLRLAMLVVLVRLVFALRQPCVRLSRSR